ncbi:hypothetical protein BV898_19677 [Hypsibius exemplaris]|uniref:Uncharacterized protein n=1 Tax=Hypsibius exemplaris TaxID=2072580 RepID=A0A9X6RP62_HYPEX|nr:hypothetical protein BV898_19677 [Hypsibius exemplaris]
MLQAKYENEAMNDNEGMIKNEAIEVASNNCPALESAPSASLMDVASPNRTKQSSLADLYRSLSQPSCDISVLPLCINTRRCNTRLTDAASSWLKYCRQKHPKGVVFVAGISAKGPTAIRFVPPRTKVNSDFYGKHVLKPLFKKDIPPLYGKQARSVALHHNSDAAHTALITVRSLQDNNYQFFSAADWPSNTPDLSPMDYTISGMFKRRLWKHKIKNLAD